MSKLAEAFEGGRSAWSRRREKLGILRDPAGENPEQARLRALAKWRFILIRGVIGWGVPMFLWLALSNFRDDLKAATSSHGSMLQHLFHSWVGAFCINALLGIIVGFLAWRRVH